MKPSRSGTASPNKRPRAFTIALVLALAVVLAFAGSFIFGLKGRQRVEPAAEVPAPRQPASVRDARPRLEVYNASRKAGLAKFATEQLRDAGFDVVQFGNAAELSATSRVIDRIGQPEIARQVAQALRITNVETAIDTSLYVDATVIVGKDWPPPKAPQKEERSLQDKLLGR